MKNQPGRTDKGAFSEVAPKRGLVARIRHLGVRLRWWSWRIEREMEEQKRAFLNHEFDADPDYFGYCWVCGKREDEHARR